MHVIQGGSKNRPKSSVIFVVSLSVWGRHEPSWATENEGFWTQWPALNPWIPTSAATMISMSVWFNMHREFEHVFTRDLAHAHLALNEVLECFKPFSLQVWALILEKAMAKFVGSYAHLSGGTPGDFPKLGGGRRVRVMSHGKLEDWILCSQCGLRYGIIWYPFANFGGRPLYSFGCIQHGSWKSLCCSFNGATLILCKDMQVPNPLHLWRLRDSHWCALAPGLAQSTFRDLFPGGTPGTKKEQMIVVFVDPRLGFIYVHNTAHMQTHI